MSSKLVERLPYEVGTREAEMNPAAFPAALDHGCDPRPSLHFGSVLVAFALRTEGCQQPRRHHLTGARQRVKDEKIGMRFRRLLDLPIQCLDSLEKDLDHLYGNLHRLHLGRNYGTVVQCGNGLAYGLHPLLN